MDILDKVALITGGKRIGLVVAETLARHGVDIALSYMHCASRGRGGSGPGQGRRPACGGSAGGLQVPEACSALVKDVAGMMGRLDILINMASVYVERPFEEMRVADWNAGLDVDLRAAFFCAQAAVPFMRTQGGGRIVNFTDWTARSGRPRYRGFVPYYVAKAGVIALTEALAFGTGG